MVVKEVNIALRQELSFKLQLTQEIRQAIELLQYSSQELFDYIEELSLDNPLIEVKEADVPSRLSTHRSLSNRNDRINDVANKSMSLQEYMKLQSVDLRLAGPEERIFSFLVGSLDANGYLQESLETVSCLLNVPLDQCERVLTKLQSLDPAGIGARSLKECILLQLKRLPDRNLKAEQIIEHHFELFAKKSWSHLSTITKLAASELQGIHDLIADLNPRPGASFAQSSVPSYIEPDFYLTEVSGNVKLECNEKCFPGITIHPGYSSFLPQSKEDELSKYLSEKRKEVDWLARSIERRKQTMMNVMMAIIERQYDFLFRGGKLKPLLLKGVADSLSIHESTVSRTVSKYVETPGGLFELKSFFSKTLQNQQEPDASSHAAKEQLRRLIEEEDKRKPYSDQKLSLLMNETYGIRLSRRTVAKYREQMKIVSSSMRKRYD
jgi:RNA polymerase sigma-54 factor